MHGPSTGARTLPCCRRAVSVGLSCCIVSSQSVGEGGWYWRGPHHRPRVWPRAPDLSSALANAGLEALGDVASPPASESVMRTTASDRALHPFPGGAYLDSVEEDENEQAADFEHSFR